VPSEASGRHAPASEAGEVAEDAPSIMRRRSIMVNRGARAVRYFSIAAAGCTYDRTGTKGNCIIVPVLCPFLGKTAADI
jgi:hypothetical protein